MSDSAEGHIGVCLVGAGVWGGVHAFALGNIGRLYPDLPGIELVVVADTQSAAAEESRRRFGFRECTTDIDAALARQDVDLVVVTAPPALAPPIILAAVANGKHVFAEKPLGTSGEDAASLLEACQRAGRRHLMGTAYRWSPAVRAIRSLIEANELGAVHRFRGTFEIDSAADPLGARVWRYQRDFAAGGAMADLGYHVIDCARFLMGEVDSVVATTYRHVEERPLPGDPGRMGPVDVEDAGSALLRFASGATGVIEVSRVAVGRKFRLLLEVFGSEGTASWDLEDPEKFWVSRRTSSGVNPFERTIVAPAHPGASEVLIGRWALTGLGLMSLELIMWSQFFGSLATNERVGADFEDGVHDSAVLEAIYRSAESGARVDVRQLVGSIR